MKKTVKSVLLMLVMAVMLFALTGCGGNKLVATRDVSEDDTFGNYKETIEVTFKDDKADKITMTMEFEDKEKAEAIASVYKLAGDELEGVETEQKGKKFIMTMSAEAFANEEGFDESLSKDDLKKALEEEGYEVK